MGEVKMAKFVKSSASAWEPTYNKTSIGRNPSLAKMNKHKRRSFKKNRGQGKAI
jgi:hypothetical protein